MYDSAMRSLEWAIMWSPRRAYADAVAHASASSRVSAIGRVILAALILGTTMATTITLVADAVVVTRTSLAWSFAILTQVAGAIALVASSPRRRVGAIRAFDLLLAASGPWTLWLAGFTWWIVTNPRGVELHGAIVTVLMPAAWTTCLVFVYCREVLSHSTRAAIVRTSLHQVAMWTIGAGYFFWAVQGWPRLIGLFG